MCQTSSQKYVHWFKVSHKLKKILFLTQLYIPPENTSVDLLEAFLSEVEQFDTDYKYVKLVGNVNARTATLDDIVEIDETLFDFLDTEVDLMLDNRVYAQLDSMNMSHRRCSQDKVSTRFGR